VADTKISAASNATIPLAGTEFVPLSQSGVSTHATIAQVFTTPIFAAGGTTSASYKLTSGTVLSTPAAGAVEYDGKVFYTTPVASARGLSPSQMFAIVAAGGFALGTTSNTSQAAFATTNDVWTLAASTGYWVEGFYRVSKSGTTAAFSMGFSGTATITAVLYYAIGQQVAVNTSGTTQSSVCVNTSAITGVVATGTTDLWVLFKGLLQINAGGTIIPIVALSSATTSPTMVAGSYITLTPIGSDTVSALGNVG
jgi:hypothetical protein